MYQSVIYPCRFSCPLHMYITMTCTSNKCTVPVLIHATFRIFFIYCSAMFMHVCEHKHCRTEHSQTNEYELTRVRVVPEAGQLVRMPTNSYAVWSSRTSTNSYADQLVRRPNRTPTNSYAWYKSCAKDPGKKAVSSQGNRVESKSLGYGR